MSTVSLLSQERSLIASPAATMNNMPQDIHDEIAAMLHSQSEDLPSLATVSRKWQSAVERQTFRRIVLRSTDLERFQTIVRGRRRAYVNIIHYQVVLPAYSDAERCRFERGDTRQTNDDAFTAAIHGLLSIMESWDVCKDGYVQLHLRDTYLSADHTVLRRFSPDYEHIKRRLLRSESGTDVIDLRNWRFRYSFLRLVHASELPLVPVVRSFTVSSMTRNICDRVPIDIASRLPSLRRLVWRMNDWDIRYIGLRRTHRYDLAQAFKTVLPQLYNLEHYTWITTISEGQRSLSGL